MKKEKYKLYEESFKSCIDNEYHTETYYTIKKGLKDKRDLYYKSTNKTEIYTLLTFIGLFLGLLFALVGIYTFENNPSKIPGIVLCLLGIFNVTLMIILNCIRIKYYSISNNTSDWKSIFQETKEYKLQQKKYTKKYKENALRKKSIKAEKMIDIYDNLDNKVLNKKDKILRIAQILDIKDVD